MAADDEKRHQNHNSHHFLLVTYGFQSHINPGRVLAHRLAQLGAGDGSVLATISVPVATYRCMFPSHDAATAAAPAETTTDGGGGGVSYVPYSDGVDDGSMPKDAEDRATRRRASSESLSAVVARLAAAGQPVTCIMSTMVFLPVLDVAREHNIPAAIYWIQPATLLAITYHYFHGYGELIASHAADDPAYEVCLPGLGRPLQISSFPSFLVDMSGTERSKAFIEVFQELFEYMDHQWRPKILVNTFDELEEKVLAEMKRRHLDVSTIGPMVGSSAETRIHLFKHDDIDNKRYMEWLQAHPEKSVVYVSFGSIIKYTKQQMDEIVGGLKQCGRPYLLVVRKDGLEDDDDEISYNSMDNTQSQGLVVGWCDQFEVLSHSAVGCFVSHCGWNSTIEAMVSGVPIIGVPNMYDQPTNMYLIEEEWKVGIKGERSCDGVLTGAELARCIESVMGEGAAAMAIRERANALKEIAQAASANISGSAERNLYDFVKTVQARDNRTMPQSIKP